MSRAETVFNSTVHKLSCTVCGINLEDATTNGLYEHVDECMCNLSKPLKDIVNNVTNYHFLWKTSYGDLLRCHQAIDNGENPLSNKKSVCKSKEEHEKTGGCKRERLYRLAAFKHITMLSSNFSSYISEKRRYEIQIMKEEHIHQLEETKDSTARKRLAIRLIRDLKTKEETSNRSRIVSHSEFSRDLRKLQEEHIKLHKDFDSKMTKLMK